MAIPALYNEKAMLQRIAEGEEAAFKALYDHYLPYLVPFLQKLTGGEVATDEIVQETFIRLWLGRDKLPGITYVNAWVFEIASHAAFTWLKKNIRYRQVLQTLPQPAGGEQHNPVNDRVNLLDIRKAIRVAIDALPDQRKRIYLLSREGGLTIPEIAQQLGLSPSTVKNALVKALAAIRGHLQQQGYYLPLFLVSLLLA